jgi:hypothetical protein
MLHVYQPWVFDDAFLSHTYVAIMFQFLIYSVHQVDAFRALENSVKSETIYPDSI